MAVVLAFMAGLLISAGLAISAVAVAARLKPSDSLAIVPIDDFGLSLSLQDRMVALLRQENGRPMTYVAMADALGVDAQQIRNKAQRKVFVILEPDSQNRTKRLALASEKKSDG